MRSPLPTPGRNRILENLWQRLTGWLRATPQGSQRPLALLSQAPAQRWYDLEIPEYPIRDRAFAVRLIEMCHHQPEVATALRIGARDILSSEDGDDLASVEVSPMGVDGVAFPADLLDAAQASLPRLFPLDTLYAIGWRVIAYGDAFLNLAISPRRDDGVGRTLLLPTWEMFRVENDAGELLGFEQRRQVDDSGAIRFHPGAIAHFRHNRQGLYGRSQFAASLDDWDEYQRAREDLSKARRAIGSNPTVHYFDDTWGGDTMIDYKAEIEKAERMRLTTNMYAPPGVKLAKLRETDPVLTPLTEDLQDKRLTFVRTSEEPIWKFAGFDTSGAREISGQPALAHSRLVNYRRQILSKGIRQVLITDLAIRFGLERLPEIDQLALKWPQFHVRPQDVEDAAPSEPPAAPTDARAMPWPRALSGLN